MLRYLLPGSAIGCALVVLFAGALGDDLRSYVSADTLSRLTPSAAGTPSPLQPAGPQQGSQATLLQAAPQALQRQVQVLQQEATALQEQLTRRSQELDRRNQELDRRTRDAQTAQTQADEFRLRVETLRQSHREDDANQQEAATRSDQTDQTVPAINQRPEPHEESVAAAQDDPDRLRLVIDALRQRNKTAADPNGVRQKAEESTSGQQRKNKSQQVTYKAQPQSAASVAAPAAIGSVDVPAPAQQLRTARQWLGAGRPDEARRLLAMVQTQLVLQPVTPDAPEARGTSVSAGNVGNAIRWLDLGANRQAMQAINQALQVLSRTGEDSNPPVTAVHAWSGYPLSLYSGYPQSDGPSYSGSPAQR